MVTKVFQLLLLLSPICTCADMNMDVFDLIFFRTGITVLFMASLWDTPRRDIPREVRIGVIGLLGICLFNAFIHAWDSVVLYNLLNVFLAAVGFCIVYRYLDISKSLIKYILAAGAINLALYIMQINAIDPVFDMKPQNGGAFLGNTPRLTNYFTLLLSFLPFPLILLGAGLVVLTKQMVLLIPIALFVLLRIKSLKLKAVFLGLLTLFACVYHRHIYISLVETRMMTYWFPALVAFFNRPLIGHGLGYRVVQDTGAVFNSYLQFIVGVGIGGAVWFGYVLRNVYKRISGSREGVAFLTLAFLMVVEYPIEIIRLWFLHIAIVAGFLIKTDAVVPGQV